MDKAYWDRLARTFSDDVLEISEHDTRGVIEAAARRLANPGVTAADFGCGVGATTRVLAKYFAKVVGIDFSRALIKEARARTRATNVSYRIADLATRRRPRVAAEIGFCINCLLSPDYDTRARIVRNVGAGVAPSGPTVFVVPSFESILQTYQVMIEVDVRQGEPRSRSVRRTASVARKEVHSLVNGVVDMGGAPTKHYLGDEIGACLSRAGFTVEGLRRVEYPWDVEFDLGSDADRILDYLGPQKPWDWLIEAKAPARD